MGFFERCPPPYRKKLLQSNHAKIINFIPFRGSRQKGSLHNPAQSVSAATPQKLHPAFGKGFEEEHRRNVTKTNICT